MSSRKVVYSCCTSSRYSASIEVAKAEGISTKTLHRAKVQLGIEVKKIGYRGAYVWVLDKSNLLEEAIMANDSQGVFLATFEEVGLLA